MSDLDAALESLRESMERLDARNDATSESLKKLQATVAALEELPRSTANGAKAADWDLYERNRADIREIVKRLRNGAH